MHLKGSLLFWILLLMAWCPAIAQYSPYTYQHYTVNDGLPSSTVYGMEQDSRGYLWLATASGLVRFDGYQFKVYTADDGLAGNEVLNTIISEDGRQWVIPFRPGPGYLVDDKLQVFKSHPVFLADRMNSVTYDLETNSYFFGFGRSGVVRVNKLNITDTTWYNVDLAPELFPAGYTFVVKDSFGNIWSGGNEHAGIYRDGQFNFRKYDIPAVTGRNNFALMSTGENGIGVGISSFMKLVVLTDTVGGYEVFFDISEHITSERVLNAIAGKQHEFFVTTNHGAYRLLREPSGVWRRDTLLFGLDVTDVFVDDEDNLWLCTLKEGLFYFSRASLSANKITDDRINAISLGFDSIVLAGAANGNLHYRRGGGAWTKKTLPITFNRFKPSVEEMLFDSTNQRFWVWCQLYLLFVDESLQLDTFYKTGLPNGESSFFLDTKFTFANNAHIVEHGNPKGLTQHKQRFWMSNPFGLQQLTYDLQSPDSNFIHRVATGRYGAVSTYHDSVLFVSNLSGLFIWDETGDSLVPLNIPILGKHNPLCFSDAGANYMLVGLDGGGVMVYTPDSSWLISLDESTAANVVNSIVWHQGAFLVATNGGVFQLPVKDGWPHAAAVSPLIINDGLPSIESISLQVVDQELLVGTSKGLVSFPLSLIEADTIIPRIFLNRAVALDSAVLLDTPLKLPYDDNALEISYVGISYKSRKHILYKYRLLGEKDYSFTENTSVRYSSLQPGKYTFEVLARSMQGVWSTEAATFSFTVLPPFWQTWWFRTMAALLAFGAVVRATYGVVRYNRNKDAIARQILELESQALRAQMNPHFIFNSLNAVHDFIADSDQRSAHIYLSRFAKLVRAILRQSRESAITLEEEIETLKLYANLEQMRFHEKFDVLFEVDSQLETDIVVLPPMIVQPYVENAIKHGLMNRTEKGQLKISIFKEAEILTFIIEDNGIGRAASALINQKHDVAHKSYGMQITAERLSVNKAGKQTGQVIITDLEGTEGEAMGTRVTLRFLLNYK